MTSSMFGLSFFGANRRKAPSIWRASSEFAPKAIVTVLPGSNARKPPFGAAAATTPTPRFSVVTRYPSLRRQFALLWAL